MDQKNMVFMGMGFELAGLAIGATYLGKHIDAYFQWNMIATMILVLASLGVWFFHIVYLLRQMDKNSEP